MNKSNLVMVALTSCMVCTVTRTGENNWSFLHLLVLNDTFKNVITEDDYRPYGMDARAVSRLRMRLSRYSTMTIEDIAALEGEQEIDINQQDSFGATALHYAAMLDLGMFNWLLKNGASPYIVDNGGWNILHYAAAHGGLDGMNETVINRYIDISKLINQQDENGSTPLHIAVCCGEGHYSGIRLLCIMSGADCHEPSVAWLLNHGADTSIRDNSFWNATPVDYARINNFEEMLALFEAKAN